LEVARIQTWQTRENILENAGNWAFVDYGGAGSGVDVNFFVLTTCWIEL